MDGPDEFDDPGPETPRPPQRGRQLLRVVIIVVLIASMVFLAFVSGRGVVTVRPEPLPVATGHARIRAQRRDGSR